MVHLMSAGRIRYLAPGREGPEDAGVPAALRRRRRARAHRGGQARSAPASGCCGPTRSRPELAHLGPEADTLTAETLAPILAGDSRRLHSLLRDQRAIAGIGRAWANEILNAARLSPYALSTQLSGEETERLADGDPRRAGPRARAAAARARRTQATYRVHDRLGEPCPNCRTPLARVDFEEHTIYYCPHCQTDGRVLKDRRMSRLLR